MDKEKPDNNTHPYMSTRGKSNQPFAYTHIKVPNMNEEKDLIPLTPNKNLSSPKNSPKNSSDQNPNPKTPAPTSPPAPTHSQDLKTYKTMRKDFNTRKRKINSLITERNDREYYLSLNKSPFKVKLQHLK